MYSQNTLTTQLAGLQEVNSKFIYVLISNSKLHACTRSTTVQVYFPELFEHTYLTTWVLKYISSRLTSIIIHFGKQQSARLLNGAQHTYLYTHCFTFVQSIVNYYGHNLFTIHLGAYQYYLRDMYMFTSSLSFKLKSIK